MLIHGPPSPELAPFVERLWHFDEVEDPPAPRGNSAGRRATRERVLPTGCASLAFRLDDAPVRIFATEGEAGGREFRHGSLCGARSTAFVRDVSAPSCSIGVQFRPGGATALLGVPAGELAERHTGADELWGADARRARERLLDERRPDARLALLERFLLERQSSRTLSRSRTARALHPAVAFLLARFAAPAPTPSIGELRRATGLSHRRLIELFRREVGLTPRDFLRVRRFQRAVEAAALGRCGGWAGIAAASGFCDQSHLIREFRALAGFAPGRYAPLAPDRPNHVPLQASADPR
jgi:AraC-like DNA-binding protein